MDSHKVEIVDVLGLKVGTFRCETGEILVSIRDILEASLSDVAAEIAVLKSQDGRAFMKVMNIYPAHCFRNGLYEEGLFITTDRLNDYLYSIRNPGSEIDTLRAYLAVEIHKHWIRIGDSAAGYTPHQLRTYVMHASDEKLSLVLGAFNLDNHDEVMANLRKFILKELGFPLLWDNLAPTQMDIYNAVLSVMGTNLYQYSQQYVDVEEAMQFVHADARKVIEGFKRPE